MDLNEACANFHRAVSHCDNLVAVHRKSGGTDAGRRREEISLNRAVVVMSIATWQAVVQDMTRACLDISEPAPGGAVNLDAWRTMVGPTRKAIIDFATPNQENTRRLMISAGFDPRPSWTWRGGQGRVLGPVQVGDRLNEWLKVRHAVAHGHDSLPEVGVLEAVKRAKGKPPGDFTLRLTDAENCLSFVRRITSATGSALAAHLSVANPVWVPAASVTNSNTKP
ncbi:hypothetical protein [Cellulosimicrobium funkei]